VLVPRNLCVGIPEGVGYDEAAYTTIGAIALQGIRQANPSIGAIVAVIGLGLLGQLTVQILKAHGCRVFGIDLDPATVRLARSSGADVALVRTSSDAVQRGVAAATAGRGVDAVIITAATPSNDPVQMAGEICREKGCVVLVGDVGLQLPRGPYYTKELDFRLSRSYGPGRYDPEYEERGHDYPFGYVRWTENRNMAEFLRLLAMKKVDVQKLTTHRFTIDDARRAYELLSANRKAGGERPLGVLLDYEATHVRGDRVVSRFDLSAQVKSSHASPLHVGFVGAGNFAQASLLPPSKSYPGISLVGVCTKDGLDAKTVGKQSGFQFATTNCKDIFENELIGTVFIATRHNLHAEFVVEALKRGKNVFVEKPLAMNETELDAIVNAYNAMVKSKKQSIVLVGFNRNFAPMVSAVKGFLADANGPMVINYRVNAGFLPESHWTRDPVEGGGRILGEVCHFVALVQHFAKGSPTKVYAESVIGEGGKNTEDDSVTITLKFSDGSVGTITYVANGDPALPKEYIEFFSTGRTAIIDNFQRLRKYEQGAMTETTTRTVQKGHREEVEAFLTAVKEKKESPIPFQSLVTTTHITFKILESLRRGTAITV
jgi:polar amino acid transport system substrate-binding protein